MPVTATMTVGVSGRHTNPLDLGSATYPFGLSAEHALVSGTAAGQADRVFTDQRTLSASATENLDLAGVLIDAFGQAITFVTIKGVFLKAAVGNTNDVQLTRPATNGVPLFLAASDGIALKPGYVFAWAGSGTGITVTAGTGDILTLTNSAGGTSVVYDIIIVGTSV